MTYEIPYKKPTYGIPYKGSKSSIISKFGFKFPKADHFYDLFGGGFAVTHWMLENRSEDFKRFHFNEIEAPLVELIKKSIMGFYNYENFQPEWISREDFFRSTDLYVKILWSFGNSGEGYLFSKEIEPYKKAMHQAVVFKEFCRLSSEVLGFSEWPDSLESITERRLFFRRKIEEYRKTKKIPTILHQFLTEQQLQRLQRLEQLQQLDQLRRLQQLERLEQLQRLDQLQRLHFYSTSYEEVPILPNSVIYCDIPYENTDGYNSLFDRQKFLEWALEQKCPVFISEYNISDTRFIEVYQVGKLVLMGRDKDGNAGKALEKIYWNGVRP